MTLSVPICLQHARTDTTYEWVLTELLAGRQSHKHICCNSHTPLTALAHMSHLSAVMRWAVYVLIAHGVALPASIHAVPTC